MNHKITPLLYDAGGDLDKRWFVYYYDENNKRVKQYGSINTYSTARDRKRIANAIIEQLTEKNKLSYRSKTRRQVDEYLQSKKGFWKPKTFISYRGKVDAFFTFLGFDEFNSDSLYRFFMHLMQTKSRGTYNSYKTTLKQVFGEGLRLNSLQIAALFQNIKTVKNTPKPLEIIPTNLIEKIKTEILEDAPQLWLVCQLQYYCFIRPGEIRNLKVADVMLEENKIVIQPSVSKNNKIRYPIIPPAFFDDLKNALENRHLEEYLCPTSLSKYKKASANIYNYWHALIMTKLGLQKRYKLYSWKPTGMIAAKKAGASMKFIKEQAGHASIDQTDAYFRSLGWRDDDNSAIYFPKI